MRARYFIQESESTWTITESNLIHTKEIGDQESLEIFILSACNNNRFPRQLIFDSCSADTLKRVLNVILKYSSLSLCISASSSQYQLHENLRKTICPVFIKAPSLKQYHQLENTLSAYYWKKIDATESTTTSMLALSDDREQQAIDQTDSYLDLFILESSDDSDRMDCDSTQPWQTDDSTPRQETQPLSPTEPQPKKLILVNYRQQLEALQQDHQHIQQQLLQSINDSTKLAQENSTLRHQLHDSREKIDELKTIISSYQNAHFFQQKMTSEQSDRVAALEAKIQTLNQYLKKSEESNAQLTSQNTALLARIEQLQQAEPAILPTKREKELTRRINSQCQTIDFLNSRVQNLETYLAKVQTNSSQDATKSSSTHSIVSANPRSTLPFFQPAETQQRHQSVATSPKPI